MAFDITCDELDLEGVATWNEQGSQRIAHQGNPRRHARLLHNFAFKNNQFVILGCEVFKDSEAELDTYIATLKKTIHSKIVRLTLKNDTRYLKAMMASFGRLYDAGRIPAKHARLSIEFECEPFWYGASRSESFLSQAPGANNAVTNNGDVEAAPLIEVSGPTGVGITITVTNTTIGMGMSFVGDVVAGQSVVFDHPNGRVLKGGGDAMANLVLPNFWELPSGNSNIRVDAPDTFNMTVQWLERYP